LSDIINQEPVLERDRIMMAMLRPLGNEKGKRFKPDARQQKLLEQAAFVGEAMAGANTFAKRFDDVRYSPDTQWAYGLGEMNPPQEAEFYTQIDERAAVLYEGTGKSKGMMIKLPGAGQAYIGTRTDSNGQWLDGTNTYRLRVPAVVPAKLFWSVTAYDNDTRSFIENKEEIADRSSRMELRKNADGSVDI
jgi:hypothetical protein